MRGNTQLRSRVISAIGDEQMTSVEIAAIIGANPRDVGLICASLGRDGALTHAGCIRTTSKLRIALWCRPGRENSIEREAEKIPNEARRPLGAVYCWPTNLTAAMFGDPLPGRSALDRKFAGGAG